METGDRGKCDPETGCFQAYHVIADSRTADSISGLYEETLLPKKWR